MSIAARGSLAGLMLALAACSSSVSPAPPSAASSSTASSSAASSSTSSLSRPATKPATTRPPSSPQPAPDLAARTLAGLGLAQRVGQLIMAEASATGSNYAAVSAVRTYAVGGLILLGQSDGQAATAVVTSALQAAAPARTKLLLATDQEGGQVQRLQGPGFSSIPSALDQGQIAPATLRDDAARWGAEIRGAGLNVDLAPVLDTVPAGFADQNPPIGQLDREYGSTPDVVASHGVAVVQGLAEARVAATVKHFPGLGRVTGNTDNSRGVTDTVTTSTDAYLAPFASAIKAGVPMVMMSTAIYTQIDPDHPAAFSSVAITGLLRGRLGFHGVVITDDVGAAAQVADVPVGERAVDLVDAGGDITLTVDTTQVSDMAGALIAQAQRDPSFRAKIDAAALRVLDLKAKLGLLS